MKRLNSFLMWSHGVVSHACDIKRGSNVFCNACYNACNGSYHTHCFRIMLLSCSYCAAKTRIIQYILLFNIVLMVILMLFMGEFFTSEVTEMSLNGHDRFLLVWL